MYITGEMVGLPAPFNGLISSSDGSTKYIEKGISATSDFIGSDFCPCHDIPGGPKVPVDGVCKHYMNVTVSSVAPHEGTFCRSPPEWVDFTKNNVCEDPKDFNPGAMEGICATVMRMCHAVAPYGGSMKSMMYIIAGITAPCCNNNTAYNNHSGCGAMKEEYIYRPVDYDKYEKVDYCDGGELNVNATAFFECKSPEDSRPYNWDDEVEQCHTNECKSSAFACIAARGMQSHTIRQKTTLCIWKPQVENVVMST